VYASDDPVDRIDPSGDNSVNLQGVANWALANWNGWYNGYGNDCTDFVSRALHFGGGDQENYGWDAPFNYWDDHYWYRSSFYLNPPWPFTTTVATDSWAGSFHLARHLWWNGSHWLQYWNQARPGDIAFANWSNYNFYGIDHAGVITKVSNGMPYVTQHSPIQINVPLTYWLYSHPTVGIWIVQPNPG
jgi:hypothetical protein